MLEQEPKKVKLKQQPKAVPSHLAAILALKQSQSIQEPVTKATEPALNSFSKAVDTYSSLRPKDTLEPDSDRSLIRVGWTKQGNLVLDFDDGAKLVSKPVPVKHEQSSTVVVGSTGSGSNAVKQAFETVSKNLAAVDYQFVYTDETLTSLVYANGIIKTLHYTDDELTSIELSGNTPLGITLTKTLTYQDGNLSEATYS